MNTEKTNINDLRPGDKLYIPWPESKTKPDWWKLPEVVTVKDIDLHKNQVGILEAGGLCLQEKEFNRILGNDPAQDDLDNGEQLEIF